MTPKTPQQRGKGNRTKGQNFERECATALTLATCFSFRRVLVEVRDGNCGDLESPLNLSIQCKVGANPPIFAAMDQAVAAARVADIPVALIRRNAAPGRKKADLAVLRLIDFYAIVNRLVIWETDCVPVGGSKLLVP